MRGLRVPHADRVHDGPELLLLHRHLLRGHHHARPRHLGLPAAGDTRGPQHGLLYPIPLQTCLTTPADAACTITAAASVPTLVQNLDTCMTRHYYILLY